MPLISSPSATAAALRFSAVTGEAVIDVSVATVWLLDAPWFSATEARQIALNSSQAYTIVAANEAVKKVIGTDAGE